jgi:hypothetical protein
MTLFKSAVAGVVWPALPDAQAAQRLALLWQFEQSERWPAELLLQHQLQQLALVIEHARRTVPFYRDRLAGQRC